MFPSLHSFCAGSFIFIAGIWDILQNTGQNVRVFLWERTVCMIDGLCIEQFGSGIVPSLDNVSSICLCSSYVCLFAIVDESRHFKKKNQSPHRVLSQSECSVAALGKQAKWILFILWELFQCQTPVLSVFSDAESRSVLYEKRKWAQTLKLINLS